MSISRGEIESFLQDIKNAINAKYYRFDVRRQKNTELFMNYVIEEEEALIVCKGLSPDDFVDKVQNEHPGYEHENLFIFGKSINLLEKFGDEEKTVNLYIKFNLTKDSKGNGYVIIISFHEQEYPVQYYKDNHTEY